MALDPNGLSRLLPTSVNGAEASRADLNLAGKDSPKAFLKVVAYLGQKPLDGRLALAFGSGATVYALQVNTKSGSDILQAYLEVRGGGVNRGELVSAHHCWRQTGTEARDPCRDIHVHQR